MFGIENNGKDQGKQGQGQKKISTTGLREKSYPPIGENKTEPTITKQVPETQESKGIPPRKPTLTRYQCFRVPDRTIHSNSRTIVGLAGPGYFYPKPSLFEVIVKPQFQEMGPGGQPCFGLPRHLRDWIPFIVMTGRLSINTFPLPVAG